MSTTQVLKWEWEALILGEVQNREQLVRIQLRAEFFCGFTWDEFVMRLAYVLGASPEPSKGWLRGFGAFSAVAKQEWLLGSAPGLCVGKTSLCTLLLVYIYSPKWQKK